MELNRVEKNLLTEIIINKRDEIHKRVNAIRKTKSYKSKIDNNFNLDYTGFLFELKGLNWEYTTLKGLTRKFQLKCSDDFIINLLTESEREIFKKHGGLEDERNKQNSIKGRIKIN